MAWTAPRTWVTSELVTSSIMNTHVRDNLLSLHHVLDVNETDVAVDNTTVETSVYSFSVPAGTLGVDGFLELLLLGDARGEVSGAALATWNVYFGGTLQLAFTVQYSTNTSRTGWELTVRLSNQNSQSVNYMWGKIVRSGGASALEFSNPAKDTSLAQTIEVKLDWDGAQAGNQNSKRWALLLASRN